MWFLQLQNCPISSKPTFCILKPTATRLCRTGDPNARTHTYKLNAALIQWQLFCALFTLIRVDYVTDHITC